MSEIAIRQGAGSAVELVGTDSAGTSVALEPHFDLTTRHLTPAQDRKSNLRRRGLPVLFSTLSGPASLVGVVAGGLVANGALTGGIATANPVLGWVMMGTSTVVGLTLTLLGFKMASDGDEDRAHWLELAAKEMSESTAIEVTGSELRVLGYPEKLPEVDSQTFGSIERVSTDESGSSTLERIALIWADGQFKLLSTNTGLKEQRELT